MPDLKNLDVQWVSLVDRAAVRDPEDTSEPMRFLVWKREQAKGEHHMPVMTEEETRAALEKAESERDQFKADLEKAQADSEEHKAALEKLQGEHKELADKVAELTKGESTEEEIDKSELPAAVRERLEKAEADAAALTERLEKAEEIAKAERETRLTKEFIAKADAYKGLPVKGEEFGPVLKAASEKLSADEFSALETALKAADEQIAESDLFKEQGRARGQSDTSALAEARQKAEELQKADPKLSDTAALDKALQADRGLQERYLAEVRG